MTLKHTRWQAVEAELAAARKARDLASLGRWAAQSRAADDPVRVASEADYQEAKAAYRTAEAAYRKACDALWGPFIAAWQKRGAKDGDPREDG